jgi:hypothetical protein
MKRARLAATLLLVVPLAATPAGAWEPETTQAGLAEQAALSSRLNTKLVTLGFTGGLFEPLTIPPADAPALLEDLHLLSPTHGMVPDARGRQTALAWLAAGAALADVPARHGANHFFDPTTGKGWQRPGRDAGDALSDKVRDMIGRLDVPERGVPAPDWITDAKNPFNLDGFLDQYAKAVTAATPGERSRHMAAALVAAGAMIHVLGDLGNPSRVRGDEGAHFAALGGGPDDLGSRLERIAALVYGRLGVPAPGAAVTRQHLRDFFSAKDGKGLADVIARTYFSPNTLPHSTKMSGDLKPRMSRPKPELPPRLNLMAASQEDGTALRSDDGTCLARYRVDRGMLRFWIDDDCMLEQLTMILPQVAAYETGMLDFLLRGELTIHSAGGIVVSGKDLGAGTIDVLVEDARGVRTSLGSAQVKGGAAELIKVPAPASGTRVIAMFRGTDTAGEPIVAVGAMPLSP